MLPSVGDAFSSTSAFKLSCHRAARQGNFEITTLSSSTIQANMVCRLHSDSTLTKLAVGTRCSFQMKAHLVNGKIVVNQAHPYHSCSAATRRVLQDAAEAWTNSKIAQLEETVKKEEQQDGRGSVSSDVSNNAAEKEDADSHSSDVSQGGSEQLYSEGDSEASDKDGLVHYPSAFELRANITQLLQTSSISFPTSTEAFPSARAILTRLHAAAQQRNFTIFRSSRDTRHDYVKVLCSRGHKRYESASEGHCRVFIEANRGADDRWRIDRAEYIHSHSISEASPDVALQRAKGGRRWRNGQERKKATTKKASQVLPCPHSSPSPEPHPKAKRPALSALAVDKSLSPPLHALPPPLPLQPHHPQAFPARIFALLASFLPFEPDNTLHLMTTILLSAGIASIDDLTTFLLLEASTVEQILLDAIQSGEMVEKLRRVVKQVRYKLAAEVLTRA
ncbi:hypothetical protein JCM11641_000664 [Rhodosporidiobolus odoratus]